MFLSLSSLISHSHYHQKLSSTLIFRQLENFISFKQPEVRGLRLLETRMLFFTRSVRLLESVIISENTVCQLFNLEKQNSFELVGETEKAHLTFETTIWHGYH